MRKLILAFLAIAAIACNDPENGNKNENLLEAKADSLFKDVINGHDIAMPKIKKLNQLIQKVKTGMDSIDGLPEAVRGKNAPLRAQLAAAHKELNEANTAMDEWMKAFKIDTFANNPEERVKYLEDQKIKVNIMKDQVLNSISKTDRLFVKP